MVELVSSEWEAAHCPDFGALWKALGRRDSGERAAAYYRTSAPPAPAPAPHAALQHPAVRFENVPRD